MDSIGLGRPLAAKLLSALPEDQLRELSTELSVFYIRKPFIDRVAIRTGAKQRVFEGSAELFERSRRTLLGGVPMPWMTR